MRKLHSVFDQSKRAELAVIALALAGQALVVWRFGGVAEMPFLLGAIAISAAVGLTLYFRLSRYDQPLRRRMALFLLGSSLFSAAALRDPIHALFQIEGLFFDMLTGVFAAAVVHYLIAKLVGPLVFGRVWCGWACWTAMVPDLLPYKRSHGRLPGRWGWLRAVHCSLSLALVSGLWYGLRYRPGAGGATALVWFLAGNLAYYLIGIALACILKDNRAFCKYVCPVSVPLKLGARFALLKVRGDPRRCCEHRVCEKVCPMDIQIAEYIKRGERVLSTECILCQACIDVCSEQALALSFGFERGGDERLHVRSGPAAPSRSVRP